MSEVKTERVTWKCVGMYKGSWCNYLITDIEIKSHRFDLGCPRCKTAFSDFIKIIDEIKTPDILLVALRQYQHNDCSGLLPGFDYEETIKVVSFLQIKIKQLELYIEKY